MRKESLRDHLNIIVDDASHPLKRHEHDEFAQAVFRKESKPPAGQIGKNPDVSYLIHSRCELASHIGITS